MALTFGTKVDYSTQTYLTEKAIDFLDSTHFVVAYYYSEVVRVKIGVISDDDTITYGSEYTVNSHNSNNVSVVCLDSTHFVVSYYDNGGSNYGEARVGVVSSGDEVAFGGIYNFSTEEQTFSRMCKLDSTHFVITYITGSDAGKSIVGVLSSGNVLAFGSEVSAGTSRDLDCASLDSTHFVITYSDRSDTSTKYGTAQVGTISSGNVITYGSKYVYRSSQTDKGRCASIDSTHFVVAYESGAGSIVGVVSSGNTIAFGSAVSFNGSTDTGTFSISKISSSNFAITYRGGSNYGTGRIGKVSGNSITYEDASVFYSGYVSIGRQDLSSTDSNNFIALYTDSSGSSSSIVGIFTTTVANTTNFFNFIN